jgi:photosystem II stability/assembly factor-like uncharacterized protein
MRRILAFLAVAAAAASLAGPFGRVPVSASFRVRQLPLTNIPHGGRVNQVAPQPSNRNVILVSTDSGGLFRTTDGGTNWARSNQLPNQLIAVVWHPTQANTVFVTVEGDVQNPRAGGIYRSSDAGVTFTRVLSLESSPGVWQNSTARGLSISPDGSFYVAATDWGVATSRDGVLWGVVGRLGVGTLYAVGALSADRAFVLGSTGSVYTTTGGGAWNRGTGFPGVTFFNAATPHPFSSSSARQSALAYANDNVLYRTTDSGATWSVYARPPVAPVGAGGNLFVKAVPRQASPTTQLTLYVGNRLEVYRYASVNQDLTVSPAAAPTVMLDSHDDSRDLCFQTDFTPYRLGNDGGIEHYTVAADRFQYPASRGGYMALQAMDVWHQWVGSSEHIYFGTQDNGIWMSPNYRLGNDWIQGPGSEGHSHSGPRNLPGGSTLVRNTMWSFPITWKTGPRYTTPAAHTPPTGGGGIPEFLWDNTYVMGTDAIPALGIQRGLIRTVDGGATWTQLATLPGGVIGQPKVSPRVPEVIWQAFEGEFDESLGRRAIKLARVTINRATGTATTIFPAMRGLSTLLRNPTMWDWPAVYGVDSWDPQNVIAVDLRPIGRGSTSDRRPKVMRSSDGGETFTNLEILNDLLEPTSYAQYASAFPTITHISFSPDDPFLIMVGTRTLGLFFSFTRGESWMTVPGSSDIPFITKVTWPSSNNPFVSSYGRGIWRVPLTVRYDEPFLGELRNLMRVVWFPGPQPDPWPYTIFAVDGRIQGASMDANGRLANLSLSPMAAVSRIGDEEKTDLFDLNYLEKLGQFSGFPAPVTPAPGDTMILGFILGSDSKVLGYLSGKDEIAQRGNRQPFDFTVGDKNGPTFKKPRATPTGGFSMPGFAMHGSPMTFDFVRFPPGTIKVELEGTKTWVSAVASTNGTGKATLPAISNESVVWVRFVSAATGRILDRIQIRIGHEED